MIQFTTLSGPRLLCASPPVLLEETATEAVEVRLRGNYRAGDVGGGVLERELDTPHVVVAIDDAIRNDGIIRVEAIEVIEGFEGHRSLLEFFLGVRCSA